MGNKNLTLLQTLLDEVQTIQFGNFDEDKIRSKTKLYIKKCFGESSEYMERLEDIHFTPSIYYRNMPKSDYYNSFCKGKKYLLNLISTMIEDLELTIEEMDKNDADESPNQKQFKIQDVDSRVVRVDCREVLDGIFNNKFVELKNGMLRYRNRD